MTISSVTSKVIYVGTGSTAAAAKVFAYPFKINSEQDLAVTDYNIVTSVGTLKVLTTDYTVSGVGVDTGGNVTLTGSYTNLPTSSWLVIQREVDLTQAVDYVENDPFPAETHEAALDKLCMADQQLQEQIDRCIKADVSQTSSSITYAGMAVFANSASSSATVAVAQASSAAVSASSASSSASQASSYAGTLTPPVLPTYGGTGVSNHNDSTITMSGNAALTVKLTGATSVTFPTTGTLATAGSGTVFVDRGDPASADFGHATMTTNGTWIDMDLSSLVSSGATAVLLAIRMSDDLPDQQLQFRKNGNSNDYAVASFFTQSVTTNVTVLGVVACDSNRIIEYYGTNTTFSNISVTLTGYWM